MKKMIFVFFACVLFACGSPATNKSTAACGEENAVGCAIEEDHQVYGIEENAPFIKIDIQKVFDMLDQKKNGIVYFGFPDCPWCKEALPILKEVLDEKGKECYYVQTRDKDRNSLIQQEEKDLMMEKSADFLEKDENNQSQFYVPFVILIEDGVITAGHVGTVDGYDTSERKMNTEEKEQLKTVYLEMIDRSN